MYRLTKTHCYVYVSYVISHHQHTLLCRDVFRKALQAVRAHYLSGENLLSLRMKFPYLLGWLNALPDARMTCLICGETEPRNDEGGGNYIITDTDCVKICFCSYLFI